MTICWKLFIFLVVCNFEAYCQFVIRGTLLETNEKNPIAYANIGILNSSIGTISNADGKFEIRIPEQYKNDTLLIAALGYYRKSFPIHDLQSPCIMYLEENATLLQNIIIKSRKIRPATTATLGNKNYNTSSLYTDSIAAGSAMALLIQNKPPHHFPGLQPPYYLTESRLRIAHNAFEKFTIRVRFLAVDSVSGLPGADLVDESILVTSTMRKGWLSIDLKKYNVSLREEDFYLVFEWLVDEEDRLMLQAQYQEFEKQYPSRVTHETVLVDGEKLSVSNWHGLNAGTSFGSSSMRIHQDEFKSYFRNNSYGKWHRSSFILAATVTVSSYTLPR